MQSKKRKKEVKDRKGKKEATIKKAKTKNYMQGMKKEEKKNWLFG